MKGRSVSEEDKKYIIENKDRMFKNQMAVALNLHQATIRRIIQKESKD